MALPLYIGGKGTPFLICAGWERAAGEGMSTDQSKLGAFGPRLADMVSRWKGACCCAGTSRWKFVEMILEKDIRNRQSGLVRIKATRHHGQ